VKTKREQQIEEENERLLHRLLNVSASGRMQHARSQSSSAVKQTPRSSAIYVKKQNEDRIQRENEQMLYRLLHTKNNYSRNAWEKDFQNHQKLLNRRANTSKPYVTKINITRKATSDDEDPSYGLRANEDRQITPQTG
jgi:hypothetical protein